MRNETLIDPALATEPATALQLPQVRNVIEPQASPRPRRALIWDSANSSSLLVARTLRDRGWIVDSILPPELPWQGELAFNGERIIALAGRDDAVIERALFAHPADALFFHGDGQIRWLLERWPRVPDSVRRNLPDAGSLEIALSKERSLELAEKLGVPVLPTRRCRMLAEAELAIGEFGGDVILKADGSSAGSAVRSLRKGERLSPALWAHLAEQTGTVMVQPRIGGPKIFVTVAYEHGREIAACGHEKLCTWPSPFGVTAIGVTRPEPAVHAQTERLFSALGWHGIANVEFRQSTDDGRWYFMEINPRVNCSIGIQAAAGIDVIGAWAAVCEGKEPEHGGRDYPAGVRYAWTVPALALLLRKPWELPWRQLLHGTYADWRDFDWATRARALRFASWAARAK